MKNIVTPISNEDVKSMNVGEMLYLSGYVFTGRDAVLPKVAQFLEAGIWNKEYNINLQGGVIFHTAVSPAGVGPTSSNKLEIESSFATLSANGIKMHLGKGAISSETINILQAYNACYAVIPPVTALLESKILSRKVLAFPELGMEAFHLLEIKDFPIIIATVNGKTIYNK